MADPEEGALRAAIERAYDEIQQRTGPRREPQKSVRQEVLGLLERERFIALCRTEAGLVRRWVLEYRAESAVAISGTVAQFSFPLFHLPYISALAQAQGELDLREETVRRVLGGRTFEEEVMRLCARD